MTASALFPASLITLTRDDSSAPRSRQWESASLLDRVARGDTLATRECIDQFGPLVWSIASRLPCTRVEIEEAVREIFADVWRNADRYHPEQGSEEVFITMIARRRLIDRMRRASRRGRTGDGDESDGPRWADASSSANACNEARAARQSIMRLRPELRRVLELAVLQGASHSEIAQRLQMPVDTVKSMVARGLIQVREFMGTAVGD